MVTDRILDWWFGLIEWMLTLFPATEGAPTSTIDLSWITAMNYFVPLNEMFGLFVGFFALGGPLVGTSLIVWVLVGILRGGQTKA
ncbi:hypothetical protein [Arthrobacter sp. B1I2]|uniref:hypothetical protein n=1 Tax=Arthrobacter sp. B1I2 TaxID=3042263 RepID=UPI0027D8D435|nr:hypothetical protein [Arthrobacter sp. B1I2]